MVSETSLLQTQLPVGDLTVTSTMIENYAINCTGNTTKLKPRFAEFLCSYQEVDVMIRTYFNCTESRTKVVNYVASITSVVIPKSLWGSPANYSRVLQSEHSIIPNEHKVDICCGQRFPDSSRVVDMKRLICTRSCKDLVQITVVGWSAKSRNLWPKESVTPIP